MEAVTNKPEAKNRKIRITVVGMYQPDRAGNEFISKLRSVVESAGMAFKYEFRAVPEDW
jgi:hypothetical protein